MNERNVTIIAGKGGVDLNEAMAAAVDAAVAMVMKGFGHRMAGFPRPFAGAGGPERFYHLLAAGSHLALCQGLAVVRPDRLRPADLGAIDCVACLHEFVKRTGHA